MLGSLIGGLAGAAASIFSSNQQADLQKKFAKNAIQWKVEDARKAGVHPLYALGANTVSYAPSNVGSDLASSLSAMGEGIDRSRAATSDAPARGVVARLALERAGLENDLLRAQISSELRRSSPPHVGPAMPAVAGAIPEVVRDPQRTTGANIGLPVTSNPFFSDAQTYEDRYGEVGGSALGLVNIPADMYHNWVRNMRSGKFNYSRNRYK